MILAISVRTAAKIAGVTTRTVKDWAHRYAIGAISEPESIGLYCSYRIDPIALCLCAEKRFNDLKSYQSGSFEPSERDTILSELGLAATEGDVLKKQPLLIEFSRPHIDADLRRRILTEAAERDLTPVQILLDAYAKHAPESRPNVR